MGKLVAINQADREIYDAFCERTNVPLFARSFWLDAVCPGTWNVIFSKRGNTVAAALPYHFKRKFGLRFLLQPQLTQFTGIQFDYALTGKTDYNRRTFARKCVDDVLAQLRELHFAYMQLCFQHGFTDWLPFYWEGFTQTTRYTYIIKDIKDMERTVASFHASKRQHLRNAAEAELTATTELTAQEFHEFHKRCRQEAGKKLLYPDDVFLNLAQALNERSRCFFLGVKGKDDKLQAAVFVVLDSDTAYQLINCTAPRYHGSGASTYVVEQAIRHCSGIVSSYDFEGSMQKSIEYSYSKFGTEQVPYMMIEKFASVPFGMAFKLLKK